MMVSPETYIGMMRDSTLEECMEERDGIYKILKDVETGAYEKNEIMTTVDPVRQYGWYLEVFALLNKLIFEKFEQCCEESSV